MKNQSIALRDIPIDMTVGDFVKHTATYIGEDAERIRLLFGSKQLNHGMYKSC
jgi:hypothetical protein